MFCKNCGKEIDDMAAVCIHCGCMVGNGQKYCQNCGKEITYGASFCTNCGQKVNSCGFCGNGANGANGANGTYNGNNNGAYNGNGMNGASNQGYYNQQNFANNQSFSNAPMNNPRAKSKLAAGLLGIFLGGLGIHNFYLGFTGKAITQLLVSILTCGIGSIFMQIWGLIEGIFYLIGKEGYTCDSKGIPLSE